MDKDCRRLSWPIVFSLAIHGALVFATHWGMTAESGMRGRSTLPARSARIDVVLRGRQPLPSGHESVQKAPAVQSGEVESKRAESADSEASESSAFSPPTEGGGILPLDGANFYPADFLSVRPVPIGDVSLASMTESGVTVSGSAVLELWISEYGFVTRVDVVRTDLPEGVIGDLSSAFMSLRFVPGQLDGVNVGAIMTVVVNYDDVFLLPVGR